MKQFIDKLISRLTESAIKTLGVSKSEFAMDKGEYSSYCSLSLYEVKEAINQLAEEYKGGWIPCSERLPEDGDNRFYECIVENHEEDVPMFCQYAEEYGFGFWQDLYDEHTLGFVDSEFSTNEELGYEKVIAWKQIEPYQKEGE